MPLTIQQIIDEAYTLVPSEVDMTQQIIWLNGIQNDFFNTVKIPRISRFITVKGQADYVLPSDIKERNIDLVHVGVLKYRSLEEDDINPLQNRYIFEDDTHTLTLIPAPYANGIAGILRYHRVSTTTFISSNLNAVPDVPEAYQWTMIPALAAYLAKTQDDDERAANFESQYKTAWNVAAQNYIDGVTNG